MGVKVGVGRQGQAEGRGEQDSLPGKLKVGWGKVQWGWRNRNLTLQMQM